MNKKMTGLAIGAVGVLTITAPALAKLFKATTSIGGDGVMNSVGPSFDDPVLKKYFFAARYASAVAQSIRPTTASRCRPTEGSPARLWAPTV